MLYLLPVTALLAGALVGTWAAGRAGWPETAGAIIGAMAGIGLAVLFLIWFDRSPAVRRRLTPTVVEVLASDPASSKDATPACCG